MNRYHLWLSAEDKEWGLVQYQKEVEELITAAGVQDASVPVVKPVGFGHFLKATTSLLLNFPGTDGESAALMTGMFHKAIGVYRRRMWQSLNPIWWMEYIVYLPANMIKYVGFSSESVFTKVLQIVYWVAGICATTIITLYPEWMKEKIQFLLKMIE